MKLKKGLPPGMMYVDERLRELVGKIHHLGERDIRELDAFIDYLIKGPETLPDPHEKPESARMYDFMNGGFEKD